MSIPDDVSEALPQCFETHCGYRRTKHACLGVQDCEWCVLDGKEQPLKQPFCSSQRVCFGGVLGAKTPYSDEIQGM